MGNKATPPYTRPAEALWGAELPVIACQSDANQTESRSGYFKIRADFKAKTLTKDRKDIT